MSYGKRYIYNVTPVFNSNSMLVNADMDGKETVSFYILTPGTLVLE